MSKRLRYVAAGRVVFGEVIYGPGGSYGPRTQGDYQLVTVVRGEARVSVEGEEMWLGPEQVGLLRPGRREMFRFAAEAATQHTWCALHPSLVDGALRRASGAVAPVQKVSHRLGQILEMGLGLPAGVSREAPGLGEALGLAALHEFLLAGDGGSGGEEAPDAVRRLLDWLGLHAAEPADLKSLAAVAGVSPSQLVKLCRRHLGTTPGRALWEARTRQGLRLLQDTGLSVSEVAFRSGFQTPFHFSRWVRGMTGKSPRALRAESWNGSRPAGAGARRGG